MERLESKGVFFLPAVVAVRVDSDLRGNRDGGEWLIFRFGTGAKNARGKQLKMSRRDLERKGETRFPFDPRAQK